MSELGARGRQLGGEQSGLAGTLTAHPIPSTVAIAARPVRPLGQLDRPVREGPIAPDAVGRPPGAYSEGQLEPSGLRTNPDFSLSNYRERDVERRTFYTSDGRIVRPRTRLGSRLYHVELPLAFSLGSLGFPTEPRGEALPGFH